MKLETSLVLGTILCGMWKNTISLSVCFQSGARFHKRSHSNPLFGGSVPRRRKQSIRNPPSPSKTTLEWERFDYSESPKWDSRFDGTRSVAASSEEAFDDIPEQETIQDRKTAENFDRHWEALQSLTPTLIADATQVLEPYVNPQRILRMNQVLSRRTKHCRFLFENPANPSNVWACLRTLDSFGIQNVDLVINSGKYSGKAAIAQKRGLRTAMGSAQWLSLRNYPSTKLAVQRLRESGHKIYASDLNPDSKDIRDIDWTLDDRPICIVMGNENDGISQEMRDLADESFSLPMCGFAESFNLSVATAITLAHLSASSGNYDEGPLRPGDLDEHELSIMRLRGIMNSVAQKRTARALLKRAGIELPREIEWS